jgi:hypothetical protein
MSQWKTTGSTDVEDYLPSPGHETAYRAGWQYCSGRLAGKAERRQGRKRGLALLGTGTLLTAVGAPIAVASFRHGANEKWLYMILGLGLMNLAFGLVALITGRSDE